MKLPVSANLGFLWTDVPLLDAVGAAARAGFDAVEFHWPYATEPSQLRQRLRDAGLPALAVNTIRGDTAAGDFGLAALPGRQAEARKAIDQAIGYAHAIGARAVHVMSGRTDHADAAKVLQENLAYGVDRAAGKGITLLLEPLNHKDAPGYFLTSFDRAAEIIADSGLRGLAIMFDCYHAAKNGLPVLETFMTHRAMIGHVQFADSQDRGEPDGARDNYPALLQAIAEAGYGGYFGAEYKPRSGTDAGLGWLASYR